MNHWAFDAIFYHIYPLGFCGAPKQNDYASPPVSRLEKITTWLDHLERMGVNALYLGPLFESVKHGYDTVDYFQVDRRLGDRATLARLSSNLHARGIRLILDGVFNHVGRDFWAFRDVIANGQNSPYQSWFHGLKFGERSPFNDPFTYTPWEGHYQLVKLNLRNPEVKQHLLKAVDGWIDEFNLDGLRLDVASELDPDFMSELASFCKQKKPDFWLLGEVIHGDYRLWANAEMLDSVTNYEGYKSLYSSHVDQNYFEIAYSLNRQFGPEGLYTGLPLYNFADNHDVDRIASQLTNPRHLFPLYCLFFTMPGVPSLYYGSEWGIEGKRTPTSDAALRPCLELETLMNGRQQELYKTIATLIRIRKENDVLRRGSYEQLFVNHKQFAFQRRFEGELAIIVVNSDDSSAEVEFPVSLQDGLHLVDHLNPGEGAIVQGGKLQNRVKPNWGRILLASHAGL